MKKFFARLFLPALAILLFCGCDKFKEEVASSKLSKDSVKPGSKGEGQCCWNLLFEGGPDCVSRSVAVTADGGHVLAGNIGEQQLGQSASVWVVKVDGNGEKVFEKAFKKDAWNEARAIALAGDSGFWVSGFTGSFHPKGRKHGFVIKLDKSGEKVFEKILDNGYWKWPKAMTVTSDGGVVIAGVSRQSRGSSEDFWVIKLDGSGNRLWEKDLGGDGDDLVYGVAEDEDGNIAAVGVTGSKGAGGADLWVILFDENGAQKWEKVLGGKKDEGGRGIARAHDGGWIVAGETESFADSWSAIWLVKLDDDGKQEWSKTISRGGSDYSHYISTAKREEYVLIAKTGSMTGRDALIMRLDKAGNVLWEREIDGLDNEWALFGKGTGDGGILFGGYLSSYKGGRAWLAATRQGENCGKCFDY